MYYKVKFADNKVGVIMAERIYACIDLKSFFASCECVERGLDPFKANLVVADSSRGSGTICLAVSPAMKKLGVSNRCRLFEIPKNIEYIMAKPKMKLYMQKSAEINSIYLRYISPDDIHVYSIDECFIDLTDYIKLYKLDAITLAKTLTGAVIEQTGICATVGVGTNMYLAKIALDITAKRSPDFIGYLDEELYKKTLWDHKPLTDFWNIGNGISARLRKFGATTMRGITKLPESVLYKEFGVNAEFIIDHAHGKESCTIKDIKEYKSKNHSLSSGQVLFSDYEVSDASLVLKEMVFNLVLKLVKVKMATNSVSLQIGYADRTVGFDSIMSKIGEHTSSLSIISKKVLDLFWSIVDRTKKVRKLNISFNNVRHLDYAVYDMFTNVDSVEKEHALLETTLDIHKKYGKNALLKGMSYLDKATQRERSKMIGGHNAGEDE